MSEGKCILIVDDDPDFQHATQVVLEKAGYRVLTAMDGPEGETAAAENRPDLILLDVMMEEIDAGFTFAERLGHKYNILLLSSIADSSIKVFDAHKMPVKGVLQKPVPTDILLQTVKHALKG